MLSYESPASGRFPGIYSKNAAPPCKARLRETA